MVRDAMAKVVKHLDSMIRTDLIVIRHNIEFCMKIEFKDIHISLDCS